MPRGGKRPGSGRKPVAEGGSVQRKVTIGIDADRAVVAYAESHDVTEAEAIRALLDVGIRVCRVAR